MTGALLLHRCCVRAPRGRDAAGDVSSVRRLPPSDRSAAGLPPAVWTIDEMGRSRHVRNLDGAGAEEFSEILLKGAAENGRCNRIKGSNRPAPHKSRSALQVSFVVSSCLLCDCA